MEWNGMEWRSLKTTKKLPNHLIIQRPNEIDQRSPIPKKIKKKKKKSQEKKKREKKKLQSTHQITQYTVD